MKCLIMNDVTFITERNAIPANRIKRRPTVKHQAPILSNYLTKAAFYFIVRSLSGRVRPNVFTRAHNE